MAVTGASLEGWFKEIYGDKTNLVPEFAVCRERVKFSTRERLGDTYQFPVRVQRGQGWTWKGGSDSLTAFTLNSIRSGATKNASLSGAMFVHRDSIAYKVIMSAAGSKEAFGDVTAEVVQDMLETLNAQLEIALLYGGTNLGTLGVAGASATTQAYYLTSATSALGLWAQLDGAAVDVFSSDFVTKRNTNALVVSLADYDTTNKRVTFSLTGDAADNAAVGSGDVIVPYGAQAAGGSAAWFSGLDKIVTNSGSLFGIDAASYPVWKGTSLSAGSAALTFSVLNRAGAMVAMRSGTQKSSVLISTQTWGDVNNDLAAIRRENENRGRIELGTQAITFYGPAGAMELIPHPMVKAGEAFVVDFGRMKRVGASDITWGLPGEYESMGAPDKFLTQLTDAAGFEMRGAFDQALICTRPRALAKVTSIVNSI